MFEPDDFREIVSAPQICLPPASSDRELLSELEQRGFQALDFPGATQDLETYLRWREHRVAPSNINLETTEGFSVALRLSTPEGALHELWSLFTSDSYWSLLAERFGIDLSQVRRDSGLQKYLDGYEISPHPDIRLKALTFMLNLNPSPRSEEVTFHTHYMTLKDEWRFIERYWDEHLDADRCWVPWPWCQTLLQQPKNNSIVIFAPGNDTLHAIRASYDHLSTQRTQFYGNLWYNTNTTTWKPDWRFFTEMRDGDGR